ncbi:MAG: PAS domain S-box protein [Deltaproteobacteria bacterium]|nr:PAS domain S-box protein [Deltaproteobacteria bacterium]
MKKNRKKRGSNDVLQESAGRALEDTQVILDSLPYRIMVINMHMLIETVNQTFLKEYGFNAEEVIGRKCYEVMKYLNRPCFELGAGCYIEERFEEIKEKGLFSTIKEYKDKNGNTRFDTIALSPILDEEGNIIQILEASRDVTERITLSKDAEKSRTFFENVIRSTVDGIVVVDTKGNVLIFNEGMERLTGYSSDDIVSSGHLSSFYDMDTAKENMKKMRSSHHGPEGMLNPTSMTITTKTGDEIPVTLSASIIKVDGREIGSVGVFTDMREVLQMRKDLEEAHLQLVQSEKIASVGRMAAGVAHEINNPLSGILIYAELLKNSLKDNPQNASDAQEIIDQTMRCKKIVSDLLEFSRQSIGKVSHFKLNDIINKALNILVNQAIFQDIEIVKDFEEDMPDMAGDIGQFQQVFINLFINAADAMEGRGKLKIKTRFDSKNSQFIISVSDTGPGISEDLREKIFDIFFSTKPVGKGTGLGLSISLNIIKLHGGSISVICPPEGGTSFIIQVPLGYMGQPVEEPVFIGSDEY